MKYKTTIWLTDEEIEGIAAIKQQYGIKTNTDAIRRAIRIAAKEKTKNVVRNPSAPSQYLERID